jgi:hypothetical protein
MFKEALSYLGRWKESCRTPEQRLLGIKHLSPDTAIPYMLVEDTGGPTLREVANDPEKEINPDDYVKWFSGLCEAVTNATNMNLVPIGISPDTVFYDAGNPGARWRICPIAPGLAMRNGLIGRGRFTPKELSHMPDVSTTHADTYALSWMLIDIVSGRPDLPRLTSVIDEAFPLEKLGRDLKGSATSQNGACVEPQMMDTILKRWLRNDAEKEVKKYLKTHKKGKKAKPGAKPATAAKSKSAPKAKKSSSSNAGAYVRMILMTLLKLTIVLVAFAGGAYGGYRLFTSKDTNKTALGTARLWSKAIVADDLQGALAFTSDEGEYQTKQLFDTIAYIEKSNSASPLASANAVTEKTSAKGYLGQATLQGENGDSFLVVTFKLHEQDDGTYRIFYVDWEGTNSSTLGF